MRQRDMPDQPVGGEIDDAHFSEQGHGHACHALQSSFVFQRSGQ